MRVYINDKAITTKPNISLFELILEQGFPTNGTAAAVNDVVIPKSKQAETILKENDKITVIQAVCGG